MSLREHLTARHRIVAARYCEVTGLAAPSRPEELEALAESLRTMVATINGRMEANAGPIAKIGDITLEVTHGGDVVAMVEGLDEKGKRARYSRFPLAGAGLLDGAVSLLKDAAEAEARRAWRLRG